MRVSIYYDTLVVNGYPRASSLEDVLVPKARLVFLEQRCECGDVLCVDLSHEGVGRRGPISEQYGRCRSSESTERENIKCRRLEST